MLSWHTGQGKAILVRECLFLYSPRPLSYDRIMHGMKLRTTIILLGLTLVTGGAFWRVTTGEFLYADDNTHVYLNPRVISDSFSDILSFWEKPYNGMYIPLTYTVWSLQAKVPRLFSDACAKPDARIFHSINLLIHIIVVWLVFWILFLITKNDIAAFCGALLFAIHPVQVESVAWVSEMKGLLGGVFSFASILFYLLYLQTAQNDAPSRQRRVYALAAIFAFLLALVSKPSTIVTPLIAFVIATGIYRRSIGQTVKELLPWLAMTILIIYYTSSMQPNENIDFIPSVAARFLIAGDNVSFYVYKLFFPVGLTLGYGRYPEYVLSQPWIWVTGSLPYIVILVLLIAGKRSTFQRKRLIVPIAVFIIGLIPVLGFKPFYYQGFSGQADRYLYIALFGPALALAYFLTKKRNIFVWGMVGLTLLILMGMTYQQTRYWLNNRLFLEHLHAINPRTTAYYTLLIQKAFEEKDFYQAAVYCEQNLKIQNSSGMRCLLGWIFMSQGNYMDAISEYTEAIHINPKVIIAYEQLGKLYLLVNDYHNASININKALRLDPNSIKAINLLGVMLHNTGKPDEAIKCLWRGLLVDPNMIDTYANLGIIFTEMGNKNQALRIYQKALEIDPGNETIINLAREVQGLANVPPMRNGVSRAERRASSQTFHQSRLHR